MSAAVDTHRTPTVVLENLDDAQLLVAVEDGANRTLYRGLIASE